MTMTVTCAACGAEFESQERLDEHVHAAQGCWVGAAGGGASPARVATATSFVEPPHGAPRPRPSTSGSASPTAGWSVGKSFWPRGKDPASQAELFASEANELGLIQPNNRVMRSRLRQTNGTVSRAAGH